MSQFVNAAHNVVNPKKQTAKKRQNWNFPQIILFPFMGDDNSVSSVLCSRSPATLSESIGLRNVAVSKAAIVRDDSIPCKKTGTTTPIMAIDIQWNKIIPFSRLNWANWLWKTRIELLIFPPLFFYIHIELFKAEFTVFCIMVRVFECGNRIGKYIPAIAENADLIAYLLYFFKIVRRHYYCRSVFFREFRQHISIVRF
jgi:hypothetical protein